MDPVSLLFIFENPSLLFLQQIKERRGSMKMAVAFFVGSQSTVSLSSGGSLGLPSRAMNTWCL